MTETIIGIALIIMAIFLVIAVLMQHGKDHRLSGSIAGGAETFFGKEKGKTVDAMLSKLTTVITIIFVILVVVLYVIQPSPEKLLEESLKTQQNTTQQKDDTETDNAPSGDETLELQAPSNNDAGVQDGTGSTTTDATPDADTNDNTNSTDNTATTDGNTVDADDSDNTDPAV